MKNGWHYVVLLSALALLMGCGEDEKDTLTVADDPEVQEEVVDKVDEKTDKESKQEESDGEEKETTNNEPTGTPSATVIKDKNGTPVQTQTTATKNPFEGYKLIEVDGGNLSGHREPNVVVNIGFGERTYWAFTNEHGQLVRVIADKIVIQDDSKEPVKSNGRYYNDEAKVPGVEQADLDEGHVIADSLGGVSNAYNITPQNSTLNRHGDQAYMEKVIRQAGGATNFEALITYPNTKTQIPSKYKYTYTVKGNTVTDEYENKNPDKVNEAQGLTGNTNKTNTGTTSGTTNNNKTNTAPAPAPTPTTSGEGDLAGVDTNGNGIVTIPEAKAAGYKMPITSDHWLYKYMIDRDGDGTVGE